MRDVTMLVDAASLIYRAYFSNPETLSAPDGGKVNAAYGFLSMLARLVADRDPTWLACADDADWRPQWRVDLIDSYKTHRLAEELGEDSPQAAADAEIGNQVPIIYELLSMLRIAVVSSPGYEAEDVIGTLVRRALGKVEIVSGDRDLFQLVRDPTVKVLYPRRGVSDLLEVDEAEIEKRYGIPGHAYGDFALLRGDPSDGLPGVRGIGEKTASSLIRRYGSLEAVIEAALTSPASGPLAKVAGSLDYLDRAARVVLITGDAPVEEVEIERPHEVDPAVFEKAAAWGLEGPARRLARALSGETRQGAGDKAG